MNLVSRPNGSKRKVLMRIIGHKGHQPLKHDNMWSKLAIAPVCIGPGFKKLLGCQANPMFGSGFATKGPRTVRTPSYFPQW